MRVQGGTNGLINLIVTGRLDPRTGQTEAERQWTRDHGSDRRQRLRRDQYRQAKDAARLRDTLAALAPF